MYYVNVQDIRLRLDGIPELADALDELAASWNGSTLHGLAQERLLHLAIETVTDVGSCLIDGYIMREASSYSDIIEIIGGEEVVDAELADRLKALTALRRPLVQEFYSWPRGELHPYTPELAGWLRRFSDQVGHYLQKEQ
ncbi:hypothetical protein B8V81_3731 [Paenibacillus pasadenensis]|uniref:DUF86 domain-containing protein n=1 Tax=Paenibacillus pasadenensis TaxID=217090 RepID=A0A2N5N4R4_9BACL|nr:HepT-like ribonuclease domain-containing protein [Paenibacillus pasadenensis]PLT45300.1 hypothetical protein B8V81_3731 [Paenibacillus pasadenensis]